MVKLHILVFMVTWLKSSPVVRVIIYFLVVALVLVVGVILYPGLRELLVLNMEDIGRRIGSFGGAPVQQPQTSISQRATHGFLALLGALIFVIPVVWTYVVTKRQEGYQKSFVQMLIILPIAVAGVVRVVRGDLALAFALAGIVAAVRFRTTLRDLKNAVFAFVVIGIGLASGTGAWVLAGIMSLILCLVIIALWKYDIGGLKPELARHTVPVRLSEALAPGEVKGTVAVGNEKLIEPLSAEEMDGVAARAERLAHYVRADALRSKKKYDTLLLVYASDADQAEEKLEELLPEYSSRCHLVDVFPSRDGTVALEYLLRLKRTADVGALLDSLGCADDCLMRAAEIKSAKGLRNLIT